MRLLVGLGNPGPAYAGHRHNVGFMAVDRIASRHGFAPWRASRQKAVTAEGRIGAHAVLLVKPETYMNESGAAVGALLRFYKGELGDLAVIHDELDLAPGRIRVKRGGGAGGHNGLRSIDAHLGAEYWRLRIGIGHPGSKERVNAHVLGNFASADRGWLDPLLDAIADAAPKLFDDPPGFANQVSVATEASRPTAALPHEKAGSA